MNKFLEKNKKKGSLAALLFLFNRGKGTIPLALMIALLAGIFVVPTHVILGLPLVGGIARRLGMSTPSSRGTEMAALSRNLRSSRYAPTLDSAGALFGRGASGRGVYGESTVGLVVGAKSVRDGAGEGDGMSAGERVEDYDLIAKGDELDGAGALDPNDKRDLDESIKLDNNDLINGIGNLDGEGGGHGGSTVRADFENLKGFRGLSGGNSSMSMGRALNPGEDDLLKRTLDEKTKVPRTGQSSRRSAGKSGNLRGRQYRSLSAAVGDNVGARRGSGRPTAMYQLAEGRAYSIAAAPPPGLCDPGGGCPGEYASNVAGAVYDGNDTEGGILSAPELGESTNPNLPEQGQIDSLTQEAEQVEKDAIACEEANEKYGPLIDEKNAQIDAQSQELNNAVCDGGPCSKGKLRQCEEIEGRMRKTCGEMNGLQREWADACPLSDRKYDEMKCTR